MPPVIALYQGISRADAGCCATYGHVPNLGQKAVSLNCTVLCSDHVQSFHKGYACCLDFRGTPLCPITTGVCPSIFYYLVDKSKSIYTSPQCVIYLLKWYTPPFTAFLAQGDVALPHLRAIPDRLAYEPSFPAQSS